MSDAVQYSRVDLHQMAQNVGVNLSQAFVDLQALYDDIDARNAKNTRDLNLPCQRGCDACCHESVFLTPLEFFLVWDWAQQNLTDAVRNAMIEQGLALYRQHQAVIEALDQAPPDGARDHLQLVKSLRYRCPLLGAAGACQVYPVRELYARLFGCSFNSEGGVYGCHLVGAHLAGKTVTLVQARPAAQRLSDLPLTGKRQVYPYYFQLLYGA